VTPPHVGAVSDGIEVRPLVPGDAAAFQELRLRGLLEAPSAFASSHEEECERTIEAVAERLAEREGKAIFGAFENGRLVGVVGLAREPMRKLAHKAGLWGMYVEPGARNRGVGRLLVAYALAYARDRLHVRQVGLGVNAKNLVAIALYKDQGFEPFGLERGFMLLNGELHDEVHMVCILQAQPGPQ
jgi:RimJ/RimL family protein N-acetyltransferase